MSRLHRVLGSCGPGMVEVEDMDGEVRRVSLLALDGPEPEPGAWLVVHSGYAVARAEPAEAEAVAAELGRGPTPGPTDRTPGPGPADRTTAVDRTDPPGTGPGPGSGGGLPGLAVAAVTALLSGVAVFVNSYGVHAISSPAVYTTAKNLVAVAVLGIVALAGRHVGAAPRLAAARRFVTGRPGRRSLRPLQWLGLAYVGVIGGGLAFVLYFDGLAETTAAPAAFWHDTLVVWVAVLAVPVLRERVSWWNVAAVGLLVVGQVALAGGAGHLAATGGELDVLAATLLWAVEVVVAKVLLRELTPATVSLVRMGVGAAALVAYLAASGDLGALVSLTAGQVGWALLTGALLAGYVGTWMTALARARALDVTSVLVGSVAVTWLLQAAAGTAPLGAADLGLLLTVAGVGAVLWAVWRRRDPGPGRALPAWRTVRAGERAAPDPGDAPR